jgi:hypothetical protein
MDDHPKPMLMPSTVSNPHTTTPERRKKHWNQTTTS